MKKRKGKLRRIGAIPGMCLSLEHDPPTHIVLEPGVYEYACPSCERTVRFTVSTPTP